MKHTPGPWTSYPCNLEKYSRVITAKGAMVQVAYTGLDHHDLIAAAPDLLALLIELVAIEGPQPGTSEWGDKARAAIAKATGQ